MESDIVKVKYREAQTSKLWVDILSVIQRHADADTYLKMRADVSEDRCELRVYKD